MDIENDINVNNRYHGGKYPFDTIIFPTDCNALGRANMPSSNLRLVLSIYIDVPPITPAIQK
jgi:hypothetical protein